MLLRKLYKLQGVTYLKKNQQNPIRMMISTGQMLTAACQENMLTSLIKLNRLHKGFHFDLMHIEFL